MIDCLFTSRTSEGGEKNYPTCELDVDDNDANVDDADNADGDGGMFLFKASIKYFFIEACSHDKHSFFPPIFFRAKMQKVRSKRLTKVQSLLMRSAIICNVFRIAVGSPTISAFTSYLF